MSTAGVALAFTVIVGLAVKLALLAGALSATVGEALMVMLLALLVVVRLRLVVTLAVRL